MSRQSIELRGVRVNNLQNVDVDIPLGSWTSICGVSGSGKSSLAFDTLYAEGQRRYFDSLSTSARQFLENWEPPEADRIDRIPPAIAIRAARKRSSNVGDRYRTTVGTASEILPYLRLLFARIGQAVCPDCQASLHQDNPDSVYRFIETLAKGTRFQIVFSIRRTEWEPADDLLIRLQADGFQRMIVDGNTRPIANVRVSELQAEDLVVVDRLVVEANMESRTRDSLETAFIAGKGRVSVLWNSACHGDMPGVRSVTIDGQRWSLRNFSHLRFCQQCVRTLVEPDPRLFDFASPLGACPVCEGFGSVLKLDQRRIVPDEQLSIRNGAIAPWKTPAYAHEQVELLALAAAYGIDTEIPFCSLTPQQVGLIWNGVPERDFGGLRGFFEWLERRKYKIQIAVFLNRWKSSETCLQCAGGRLRPDALAYRIAGSNIVQVSQLDIATAAEFFSRLQLPPDQQLVVRPTLQRISSRMNFLMDVGLSHLTLDRPLSTLSSGETQRVWLTKILGSSLSDMLYVLDEPSSGLHPSEIEKLADSIGSLRDRGNTLVVVDHNESLLTSADQIVELGPRAGSDGGQIVFAGSSQELTRAEGSLTGQFLMGLGGMREPRRPRRQPRGRLWIRGAHANNLKSVDVEIPLGCLCAITGVSGCGKSSLMEQTLYPAVERRLNERDLTGLPLQGLEGADAIDEVVMINQAPIGRSSRSNPITYIKAYDEIRQTYAQCPEAKTRNLKPGHFSFNVAGGRCDKCLGEGVLTIDMQFMPDLQVTCDQCHGDRFRDTVLNVRYRAKNIREVLDMTAQQAFVFFRGQPKVQSRLKALIDVGLDYIRLGQSTATFSSGEAQRLKLAHYLNAPKSRRVLFLMDEPSFGLHGHDVGKLVACFGALLAAGHSLVVIEHNLHVLKHADWIIDLGPGGAHDGGQLVAAGILEDVAAHPTSLTGQFLQRFI